jgi:hypothetical protein
MINIIGSSLAALISVIKLSETNEVTWRKTNKRVGGHFAGLDLNKIPFDIGMVVNEPYSTKFSHTAKPRIPARQSGLPYVSMVYKFLDSIGMEFKDIDILTFYNHSLLKDYLIADNLEFLLEIPEYQREILSQECSSFIGFASDAHPKFKLTNPIYQTWSYDAIMEATTPRFFFEEFIYPWLSKMHRNIQAIVPAIEHRAIWAPIYYPETIMQVLSRDIEANLLERKFIVPKDQTVNQFIKELQSKVRERPQVLEDDSNNNNLRLFLKKSDDENYFFGTPGELNSILNSNINIPVAAKSRNIILVYGKFDEFINIEQVINIVDQEFDAYRVTFRSLIQENDQISIFSIEFGDNTPELYDFNFNILKFFAMIKIDMPFQILKVQKAQVPIFDVAHCELRQNMYHDATSLLDSHGIYGSVIDFRSSSFNDQVLLGLWNYE